MKCLAKPFTHWLLSAVFLIVSAMSVGQSQPDRVDEIWGFVDNRMIRQLDFWFDDGNFPATIEVIRLQVEHEDSEENITNLGWMLENIEGNAEVPPIYKAYAARHPEDPDATYPLGWHWFVRRNFKEVIQVLLPSISKNPSPNSYRILAKSYERENELKKAVEIWEKQLKRWPDDGACKANIERVKKKLQGS